MAVAGLAALAGLAPIDPTAHAYAATALALIGYALVHAAIGLIGALFVMARARAGFVSSLRRLEPRVLALWQGYTALSGLAVLALLVGAAPVVG
jgi:cytochrome c oxidase subunit I+III